MAEERWWPPQWRESNAAVFSRTGMLWGHPLVNIVAEITPGQAFMGRTGYMFIVQNDDPTAVPDLLTLRCVLMTLAGRARAAHLPREYLDDPS